MKRAVTLAVVLLSVAAVAAAAGPKKPDPKALITGMTGAFKKISDYQAQFEWVEIKKGKETRILCDFKFMQPDYQRVFVMEGDNKGSAAAYNPSKSTTRVAAKKGMLPMPGGLPKNSKLIDGFFDSGIGADIEEIQTQAAKAKLTLKGEEKVDGRNARVIEIVPDAPVKYTRTIAWVDAALGIPIRVEYYKDGKFHGRKTWQNLKLAPGLKADDFVP